MAEKPPRKRRLRWLVLAGVGGIGVYVLRSRRAGSAALLEQWPAPAPESTPRAAAPPVPAAAAKPAAAATGSAAAVGAPEQTAPEPAVPEQAVPEPVRPPQPPVSSLGGQALFAPAGPNDIDPVPASAPTAAPIRPSPKPRHRAGPQPVRDHGLGSAEPLPDGSAPGPEYTIKGSSQSMLFHRPDSPHFARTKAEVWFRTATDARAAGFSEAGARKRVED